MATNTEILAAELERRKLMEPLRLFRPNGGQERFIEAISDDKNTVIVFAAGNWLGKTAAAIACLGALIWPHMAEAKCFNNPLFKQWPYPKRARIISTPKELESIGSVQNEIKRWWPRGKYTAEKCGKTYPSQFNANGWTIDLLTYDMAIDQFEGATVPFFIFNEPSPEEIFNACLARMKFGGKILMPMTPLTGSAWIYDRLVSHDGEKGVKVIYGATEENCIEHGKGGVIPHKAIQALSDSCDPDDREARLNGKFMHLAGQIYKTFNRDTHVIKNANLHEIIGGKQIYMVCDPAIGKPLAIIWGAVGDNGELVIFDEYPESDFHGARDNNLTVKEYSDMIIAREGGHRAHERILDRHFGNTRRTCGGLTLKQEFGEFGIDFQDSYSIPDKSSEVETGIMKVKDLLRYNAAKPLDNINRPRLMVTDNCKNTIHSFERWRRDEKTGKPMEDYKDHADCVRYLAMANPEAESYRPFEVSPGHYGVGN